MIAYTQVILLLLSIGFSAFLFWCYFSWRRIPEELAMGSISPTKLSVIIAARNEEKNIIKCLEALCNQDFPAQQVELIFVDDHSSDNTVVLIRQFINEHSDRTIKLLSLKNDEGSSKKDALTLGVSAATNDCILITDADCLVPSTWLSAMTRFFLAKNSQFLAGPVSIDSEKSLFAKIQSLEFMGLVGIAAAGIINKVPIMCNGANLMFSKKVFNEVGGFDSPEHFASGDDTQLLIKVSKLYPDSVHFLKDKRAIVRTEGAVSIEDFLQQRKRWAGKIPFALSTFTISVAILSWLTHAFLVLSLILGIIYSLSLYFIASLGMIYTCEYLLLNSMARFFNKYSVLKLILPLQLFYWIYIVLIGAIAPLSKFQWKGRITR